MRACILRDLYDKKKVPNYFGCLIKHICFISNWRDVFTEYNSTCSEYQGFVQSQIGHDGFVFRLETFLVMLTGVSGIWTSLNWHIGLILGSTQFKVTAEPTKELLLILLTIK